MELHREPISSYFSKVGALQMFLLSLSCLVLYVIQLHYTRTVRKINLLSGPPSMPIIGHALTLINSEKRIPTLMKWHRIYGNHIRLFLGYGRPVVCLTAPEDVQKILSSMETHRKSKMYKAMNSWFGKGIIMVTGKPWQEIRKLTVPAFHLKVIEAFMPTFNKHGKEFAQTLKSKATESSLINVDHCVAEATLKTVFETSFGTPLETMENPQAVVQATVRLAEAIITRMVRPWLEADFIWNLSSYGREEKRNIRTMNDVVIKVMESRKLAAKNGHLSHVGLLTSGQEDGEQKMTNTKFRVPFMDLMVVKQAEGYKVLSDEVIRDTTSTVTAAGHDTVANTISWALCFIGSHLKVQEHIHQELDEIFAGDLDRDITLDDLTKMQYLECCIKETLRMIPPLPLIVRYIEEDVKLDDGKILPKGADAVIFVYGVHRNPEIYPEPDTFDPSRFFPENSAGRHPYSFIPFSAGPKSCLGHRYAMREMKVFLAYVFKQFSVTAADKIQDITMVSDLVLRAKDGINITIKHRQA